MVHSKPTHFVVDGSNIATEGRSKPSLEQLNEAVLAFMKQYPDVTITVIVDATFGHRIAKGEVKAFDEAVANNELVAPPAGAIGRGDAFVLAIADQADAGVLSNDSFQEFHGEYDWLFEPGRLIGGKPVPNVGWVFVARTPVRGPKSRAATQKPRRSKVSAEELTNAKKQAASRVRPKGTAEQADGSERVATDEHDNRNAKPKRRKAVATESSHGKSRVARSKADSSGGEQFVNELLPFLEFVEQHRPGSAVVGKVDRYSSHGSYIDVDGVSLYLPLQNMDDPPPNSARSVVQLNDSIEVVVVGFQPERRSIDVALAARASAALAEAGAPELVVEEAGTVAPPAKKTPAKKTPAKKTPAKKTPAKKTPAKKTPAKKTPAKKTPAKKTPAKKTPAKKTPAKKTPAKKTPAKKTPAKKTPAKKTPAKKTPAKKTPAKKTPAKKTPAKKNPSASRGAHG